MTSVHIRYETALVWHDMPLLYRGRDADGRPAIASATARDQDGAAVYLAALVREDDMAACLAGRIDVREMFETRRIGPLLEGVLLVDPAPFRPVDGVAERDLPGRDFYLRPGGGFAATPAGRT